MRILIVAEFFAPDSVIGAVRITKFAKYLYQFGHDITVLCSAKCTGKRDTTLLKELDGIKIYRYNSGIDESVHKDRNKPQMSLYYIKKAVRKFCKETIYPFRYYIKANSDEKSIIRFYAQNLSDERYDIVFATFSPLAAVKAGNEIAKKNGAKFIADLRDLMDSVNYPFFIRKINRPIQKKIIKNAEAVIVVSNGQKNILLRKYAQYDRKVIVINNGYDDINIPEEKSSSGKELVIVYTGILYGGKRDLSALFEVINRIRMEYEYKFKFIYAGTDVEELRKQMNAYKLKGILDNRGALNRADAEKVQMEADLFLVAAWNTEREQGQMTGKFYEGIRARKPILVLMGGDVPNSDLYKLYKKYNYGYCYEKCAAESDKGLYNYMLKICREKHINGKIDYHQSEKLENRFKYKMLSRMLEQVLIEIGGK